CCLPGSGKGQVIIKTPRPLQGNAIRQGCPQAMLRSEGEAVRGLTVLPEAPTGARDRRPSRTVDDAPPRSQSRETRKKKGLLPGAAPALLSRSRSRTAHALSSRQASA